jgi:insulysin
MKLIKPKLDLRKFYGGKLENGIKYIFINDKYLETSYVTIAVNIGTFADTINGLAHFLEHMLFMGSKKYPDVDYYFNKLKELGGSSNAYTDNFNTVYYFSVFNDGLDEIFDIFSRFFIDPLLKKESIDKEMNAVNNEHLKNINNDSWKIEYFINFISNKNSSINKFGTGSIETLNIPNIRELLIEFYKKYYISENISICIASSLPKENLYKILFNTFGNIKKKNNQPYLIEKPFYSENLLKTYHLKTLTEIYKLIYIWEIPNLQDYVNSKDFDILEYFLLNNSENSLSFYLYNLGYLVNLNIEILYEGKFIFYLSLTKKGFENIIKIESLIFTYLNYIYTLNLKDYAYYIKEILDFNFNYNNKIETNNNLCNLLATNHFNLDTNNVFKNSLCIGLISDNSINDLFKKYINSDNFIKILISNEKIDNKYEYKELNFYEKTYYAILNNKSNIKLIDNKILLKIDLSNKYLDSNIKLIKKLDEFNIPIILKKNNKWREWYGGCSKFNEPIIRICLQLNKNNYANTCYNYLLTNISCDIINFILSFKFNKEFELSYNIFLKMNSTLSSLLINIKSLNDIIKLKLLINDFCIFINNISEYLNKISNDYIENLLLTYENIIKNIKFSNPYEYSIYIITLNLLPNSYSIEELLVNLKKINHNILKNYINNELFKEINLTIITYGNIYIYNNLFEDLNNIFTFNKEPYQQIQLQKKLNNIIIKHPNENETSICVSNFFKIGLFIPKKYLIMHLIYKIFSQPFFNKLRTEKQLGYLVKMTISIYDEIFYINQIVQSDKDIKIINKEINKFNKNLKKILKKINLSIYKDLIKKDLLEPEHSLDEKYTKYVNEIISKQYLFYKNEILLDIIDKINLNDLLDFIKLYLNNKNMKQIIIN